VGVALFVAGWVVSAVGTLILTFAYLFGKSSPFANCSKVGLLFTIAIAISLLFSIVGSATNFATYDHNQNELTVGLWQLQNFTVTPLFEYTTETSIGDIPCDDLKQRIRAGEAFSILSCAFLFFALAISCLRFLYANLRIVGSAVGFFGSICQLITWGIGATLYNQSFCGQGSLRSNGYNIGVGLGLYVAGWCLTTVIVVINGVFP